MAAATLLEYNPVPNPKNPVSEIHEGEKNYFNFLHVQCSKELVPLVPAGNQE